MVLKKWVCVFDLGKVFQSFLLSGVWSDVVEVNELRDGDNISLWFFRFNGFFFFVFDFVGDFVDFLE